MTRRGVSVIIPVCGRFELARRAVLSALSQTWRPLEVIIVDDGSTPPFVYDESNHTDRELRLIRLEQNRGPGFAREQGRLAARFELLAYLDSDDYWQPTFLERAATMLAMNGRYGMVYTRALRVVNGSVLGTVKASDRTVNTFLPTVLWRRPWHTSGCLWRREVTDRIGPWLPLWSWEDYEYDARAGLLGVEIGHVDEPLVFVEQPDFGRLSTDTLPARAAESRAKAAVSIARMLRHSPWATHPLIRKRMVWLLLSFSAQAAEHGCTASARACLAELRRWPIDPVARLSVHASSWSLTEPWRAIGRWLAPKLLRRARIAYGHQGEVTLTAPSST